MSAEPLFKFPHTPYLIPPQTSVSLRQDKVLSFDEAKLFFTERVVVEEKIDGANLGISFNKDGSMCLQNRGHYLFEPFVGQWEPLPKWIKNWADVLFDILFDKYILFGEWCYLKHSVFYNRLPDWFIAFDVFDKGNHRFLSTKRRNDVINKIGLPIVPLIYNGFISKELIIGAKGKTIFGEDEREGVYLRVDSNDYLIGRAKHVRSSFTQAIDTHWSKSTVVHNELIRSYYRLPDN